MMNKFIEVDTPPCRLLLTEEEVFPYHWQEVVGTMKSLIQKESRLNLSNNRIHIMFHTEVVNPLFYSEFCSIGLEVLGPSSEIDEDYSFYDRDETTVLQIVTQLKADFLATDLFVKVEKAQRELEVSALWEIVFCEVEGFLNCEINLFKK